MNNCLGSRNEINQKILLEKKNKETIMRNFYLNVRLVDYFKTLHAYFLYSFTTKYFRRYIDLNTTI
ncbi:hypothetical protein SFRURICE_002353 [Spodoptera frugiperda]|nr:hypothetical protein SFRURICE_002353 [Spodoptera frugiperda]